MSEFIGSRISLISKSDVRYVGKLHEINSEDSTVALENVKSYGTEGRKAEQGKPEEDMPASDSLYDYIVFRGSDVKDLRIEEAPKEPAPSPYPLNDPAILSGGRRPPQQPSQSQPQQPQQPQNFPQHPPNHDPGNQYPHQPFAPPAFPPYGYPPHDRFPGLPHHNGPHSGFQGPPPGRFPQYGQYGPPPPGWYPPPGPGFRPPYGQFPPGPHVNPAQRMQEASGPQVPGKPESKADAREEPSQKPASQAPKFEPQPNEASPVPTSAPEKAAAGPSEPASAATQAASMAVKASAADSAVPVSETAAKVVIPKGPQNKVALPIPKAAAKSAADASRESAPSQAAVAPSGPKIPNQAAVNAQLQYQNAARAATAAVAAAMAKLPAASAGNNAGASRNPPGGVDNLTQKVNEMRIEERARHPRGFRGDRGEGRGRSGRRGGRGDHHAKNIEVPATDFDFESANAKFKKEVVVKEVIANGEAGGEATNGSRADGDTSKDDDDVVIPAAPAVYNKSSFFDNISSEAKDRELGLTTTKPSRGAFRGEERRKNLETFGLGSVDSGFRGGFRGRGRGRGYRGGSGRSGFRGNSGAEAAKVSG